MEYANPEEEWHAFLSGTHPHLQHGSPLRFLPSSPRCKICRAPFGRPGSFVLRRYGYIPWEKNPKICGRCFKGFSEQAAQCPKFEGEEIGGAEVELSMLFADVRGSSKIARQMPTLDFTRLMNRFYRVASEVLFETDAIVEKFVGDEVVGLFLPFMTGPDHARKAVEAAKALMRETGHGSAEGEWVPLGAGVHTGTAFVGVVGSSESTADFTALGDPVNVTAHLASQAAIGEVLVTTQAAAAAALDDDGLERRSLSLKGYPVEALVLVPEASASGTVAPAP
jgi:adenylate cyclase